jgi:hypothetical protein
MKLDQVLNEWNDWDDLSGHHRAGASEADREEIINDIYQYLNQPHMKRHMEKHCPRLLASNSLDAIADQVAFTPIDGKNVIDWIDGDEYYTDDDFEDQVEDALQKLEEPLWH